MKITFHGAAQNVTGSKHLIETAAGSKILLDCGFHQGHRREAEKLNRAFPLDASMVDAVIISHAHLDHCGLLPLLVKKGYRGPIYATPATCDVMAHMLEDSTDIQVGDAEYLNRHLEKGQAPIQPLYDEDDCQETLKLFRPVQYANLGEGWAAAAPDVQFKFYDAGHILGSAVAVLEVSEGNRTKRLAFSGDLGHKNAPILRDPEYIEEEIDTLLLEATYGNRLHEPMGEVRKVLQNAIEFAVKHHGKIIVPAFALGRTQELIYILHKMFHTAGFPKIPVFLDSPLATRVTEVFKRHRNIFDKQSRADFNFADDLPLVFEDLTYTPTRQDSMKLNNLDGPLAIISASGMMEGGRVLHHLKHNIENPNTQILITGYQARNTLGRRIQEGVSPIRIYNQTYQPKARVIDVPALSAHADQAGLLDYVDKTRGLSKLFLVHGEEEAMAVFSDLVRAKQPTLAVHAPTRGESVEV